MTRRPRARDAGLTGAELAPIERWWLAADRLMELHERGACGCSLKSRRRCGTARMGEVAH